MLSEPNSLLVGASSFYTLQKVRKKALKNSLNLEGVHPYSIKEDMGLSPCSVKQLFLRGIDSIRVAHVFEGGGVFFPFLADLGPEVEIDVFFQ